MPGGDCNIRPEDGVQFAEGNNAAEKWTEESALEIGKGLLEWFKKDDNIFYEEYLIIKCGYYRGLIGYLSKKYSSFFDLIQHAKAIQEIKLLKGGVKSDLSSAMTKFLLINNHGYKSTNEEKPDGLGNDNITTIVIPQPNENKEFQEANVITDEQIKAIKEKNEIDN
jgi:hypothetical protein